MIQSTIVGTLGISFGMSGTFPLNGLFLGGAQVVSVEPGMTGPYSNNNLRKGSF